MQSFTAFVSAVLTSALFSSAAQATGMVQFNSMSFLRSSIDRSTTVSYLSLGPQFETTGQTISSKLDLKAITFLSDQPILSAEAPNAYITTSKEISQLHQATIGRRWYSWSILDDRWRMGLWNPRFTWDPIYPETIGLTGAFYTYESKNVSVLLYGSPIAIPERGAPLAVQNGQLVSPQPLMKPMPNLISGLVGNSVTPINYSLSYPTISQMLFRPNAAMSVKYKTDNGIWANANYGFLPIHQADIYLGIGLSTATAQINANILPQFHMQQITAFEGGYHSGVFSLWASAQAQNPIVNDSPDLSTVAPTIIRNSIGPATLLSAGADFHLIHNVLTLQTSVLNIDETASPVASSGPAISVALPSRFWFKKAFQLGAKYGIADSRFTYTANLINDVEQMSQLASFDVAFRPFVNKTGSAWNQLSVGVGTDIFSSATGLGTIGQFVGEDRVRGRMTYAF